MFKFKILLSLLIFTLLFPILSLAQNYQPLSQMQLYNIAPSQTRYVNNLSGKWQMLTPQGNWEETYLPTSGHYDNEITFRQGFNLDRAQISSYSWHLYFTGIEDQVEVYLNDVFVGRYTGGLIPFKIRMPKKNIEPGQNILKLVVAPSTKTADQIKSQTLYAKKLYRGVLRDIILMGTPNIWISNYKLKQSFNSDYTQAQLDVTVDISSSDISTLARMRNPNDTNSVAASFNSTQVDLQVTLKNKSTGEVVATAEPKTIAIEPERNVNSNVNLTVQNPVLWSNSNPQLYQLSLKLLKTGQDIDEYSPEIGFVDVNFSGNRSTVNGQPFTLKAVTYIEDYNNYKQTIPASVLEEDVRLIKTLGANTIRVKYNPPSPYLVHLCNQYGLFLMVELPVYDIPEKLLSSDEIKVRMKNFAERMVEAYDNNPCLLAFGTSTGAVESTNEIKDYNSEILPVFKKSGKPVYKIISISSPSINTDDFDLIGIDDNSRPDDFSKIKERVSIIKDLAGNTPIFLVYGIAIQPENVNGYSDKLSKEYQAYYIKNYYQIIEELNLAGSVIETFNDYLLNHPLLIANNEDHDLSSTGLVSRNRQSRISFDMLQALFNNEKEPLLNAGSFAESTPVSFIIIGLSLAIIIIFLINRFRRFREYFFRSLLRPYNFYADIRDQRIMSTSQTILLGLVIAITLGIFFASMLYFYRNNSIAQYALMIMLPIDQIQSLLYQAIWEPLILMGVIAVFTLILMFIITLIIKIFAFFLRAKIYFTDALIISVWAGVPLILLLPLAIVLIRVLVISPESAGIMLIIAGALLLWSLTRLIKSTSVVFDRPLLKVYATALIILIIAIGLPLVIYEYKYSVFAYATYFFEVVIS